MNSWFFSKRWSDKYGTLEGTVDGHKPLTLKRENVLIGSCIDCTLEETEEERLEMLASDDAVQGKDEGLVAVVEDNRVASGKATLQFCGPSPRTGLS